MPAFAYQAVDVGGKRVRGQAEAANPEAVARTLQDQGLLVVRVDAAVAQVPATTRGFGSVRRTALLEATRALSALLPAGMPLARALAAIRHLATGEVADAFDAVRVRVERGESFATALTAHTASTALFSPLYVGLVRAGEKSGDLAGALARVTAQLEREEQLRARLVSASIYPLLLLTMGGIALVVLLLFVLPRFVELFQGAGATLPGSTALVLAVSSGVRRFWPLALGLPLVAGLAGSAYGMTPAGRRALASVWLAVPGIRSLRREALAARFARLLGVLLGGGAPLVTALGDTVDSLADPLAKDEVERIRGRVREGAPLHRAIGEGTLFPPLLAQLVAVGEESGRLQDFVAKAAQILEDRTERALQRLVTLVEPALIVGLGAIVGFVALSLLQAIYGINAGALR